MFSLFCRKLMPGRSSRFLRNFSSSLDSTQWLMFFGIRLSIRNQRTGTSSVMLQPGTWWPRMTSGKSNLSNFIWIVLHRSEWKIMKTYRQIIVSSILFGNVFQYSLGLIKYPSKGLIKVLMMSKDVTYHNLKVCKNKTTRCFVQFW